MTASFNILFNKKECEFKTPGDNYKCFISEMLSVTKMQVYHSVVIENLLRVKIRIQSFHRSTPGKIKRSKTIACHCHLSSIRMNHVIIEITSVSIQQYSR